MNVTRHASPEDFLAATQATLEQNEAANSVLLGIARRLATTPNWYSSKPYFISSSDGAGITAACMVSPPHNLVVFSRDENNAETLGILADRVIADNIFLPGVIGPQQTSRLFAKLYGARTTRGQVVKMRQRLYELQEILSIRESAGRLRNATEADRLWITEWAIAFQDEALDGEEASRMEELVLRFIAANSLYVWEDGQPVSMMAKARPTRHGITINMVFTPPEFRNRGYATTSVAELSRQLLAGGYSFCTLFTDLANLTSNNIYKKIGYIPVCDFVMIKFDD